MPASLKSRLANFLTGVLGSVIQASDSFIERFGLPARPQRPTEIVAVSWEPKLLPEALESPLMSLNFYSSKNVEEKTLESCWDSSVICNLKSGAEKFCARIAVSTLRNCGDYSTPCWIVAYLMTCGDSKTDPPPRLEFLRELPPLLPLCYDAFASASSYECFNS